MTYHRLYTITVKASFEGYKGRKDVLKDMFDNYLKAVGGYATHTSFEKEGTLSLHLHAIISCPLITSKTAIQKLFIGWHTRVDVIRYRDYEQVEDIWMKYTNKEKSDADKYTLLYGCMIPLPTDNHPLRDLY